MLDTRVKLLPESHGHCNVWLLESATGYLLVDPAVAPEQVEQREEVTALLATHGHYDHVRHIDTWRGNYSHLKLMIHEDDADMLTNSINNASIFFGNAVALSGADILVQDGQELDLGDNLYLQVFHTPGHTKGSSCFLYLHRDESNQEEYIALLTGDTIFATDIGRMDLPGGSEVDMRLSLMKLRELRVQLPPDLPVLPGHGSATTLAFLKRNRWFMEL